MEAPMKRIAALFVLAGLAVVGTAVASADSGNPNGDTRDCGNGNSIKLTGPTSLWPPNHKYRTETITATGGRPLTVTLNTTVTSNEPDVGLGSGGPQHALDANPPAAMNSGQGSATTSHQLRGERSGKGSGRTYTIDAKATFDQGASQCEQTFTVTVPHDMGKS
jgi:hypothetical protein